MKYIFNTSGDYVGFVQNDHLFTPDGDWLGFILNGNEIYSAEDLSFVGYVSSDDRIVRRRGGYEPFKPRPLRPLRPLRPFRPMRPLRRLRMLPLPYPWEDVFE